MTKTNADRMFESYMDGSYYYKKSDSIRLTDDNIITDYNTPIGRIEDLECEDGMYRQFVILSLQQFKSQRSWKVHIKQIVKAAARVGYLVLFVDSVDIGFGQTMVMEPDKLHLQRLMDIYKLSNCPVENAKNSVGVIDNWYDDSVGHSYTRALYTMTQFIDDETYTPEDILLLYLKAENKKVYPKVKVMSLKNMSVSSILTAIDFGMTRNIYYHPVERIELEYHLDILDQILSRKRLSLFNTPIILTREISKEVDKFFAKEE